MYVGPFFCQAQERKSVGLSYGKGNGSFGNFGKAATGFSNHQKSLNIFGLHYWHGLSKHLVFETGIQFIRYNYVTSSFLPSYIPINNSLTVFSVPFKLRYEIGKYVFFNGGLTADISKGKESDINGIGGGIGIGFQTNVFKQLSLYINPQANIHGVIPNGSFFVESHISFGVAYPIIKK